MLFNVSVAQNNFSIVGKWKVVALNIDGVYKNFKTDSMFTNTEVKKRLTTDKQYNQEIENTLKDMKNFELVFTETTCTAYINGKAEPVENYSIDYFKRKMMISNSQMKSDDEVNYTYDKGILTLNMDATGTKFIIEMEKADK